MRREDQRRAAAQGLGDGARPRLADHQVGAAQPAGHGGDEALHGQPPTGPPGQPGEPPAQVPVAPADGHHVHVRAVPQHGRCPAVDPAGPFRTAGHHHREPLPRQTQRPPQRQPLGRARRAGHEPGSHRQPSLPAPAVAGPVLPVVPPGRRRRHDHLVRPAVPPRPVGGDQVGNHGDDRHPGRVPVPGRQRRADGHRVERDDDRGRAVGDRGRRDPRHRGEQGRIQPPHRPLGVGETPEEPPQPGCQPDTRAVQPDDPALRPGTARPGDRVADDRLEPARPGPFQRLADRASGAAVATAGVADQEQQRQGCVHGFSHSSRPAGRPAASRPYSPSHSASPR